MKAYELNLELNFVLNGDMRLGNYAKALANFENAIRVRSDHAFAYYYASTCCCYLGDDVKERLYFRKYLKIIRESTFWRNYAREYYLEPEEV